MPKFSRVENNLCAFAFEGHHEAPVWATESSYSNPTIYAVKSAAGIWYAYSMCRQSRWHLRAEGRTRLECVERAKNSRVAVKAPMVPQPVQQAQSNATRIAEITQELGNAGDDYTDLDIAELSAEREALEIVSDVSPAATVIRSAQSIRDALDPALVARYVWRMRRMMPERFTSRHPQSTLASDMLRAARADTKDRFPAEFTGWQTGRGTEERFIENPAECGLRFVGYADEIVNLRHTGHFTDRVFQQSIMRGVVYQMPSHRGKLLFVAGYNLSDNPDGSAVLDFSHIHREKCCSDRFDYKDINEFARDAAYAADGMAERAAESEYDYQESDRAGSDYIEAGAEYRETRAKFIRHSQALRDGSNITLEIRQDVTREFMSKREELMIKRAKLFEAHGNTDAFREHLPE